MQPEGGTKGQLRIEIKNKQFQALFYVETIENLFKANKMKTQFPIVGLAFGLLYLTICRVYFIGAELTGKIMRD